MFYLFNFDRYSYLQFNSDRYFDSCSLQFLFVYNSRSNISKKESQNLIFKLLLQSNLREGSDNSDKFYNQFGCRNTNLQKQIGLYAVEPIDNPNIIAVAINPKEYFESFHDKIFNLKHKGIPKATRAYEAYVERIMDLKDDTEQDEKAKQFVQRHFQVKNTNMQMVSIKKLSVCRS